MRRIGIGNGILAEMQPQEGMTCMHMEHMDRIVMVSMRMSWYLH